MTGGYTPPAGQITGSASVSGSLTVGGVTQLNGNLILGVGNNWEVTQNNGLNTVSGGIQTAAGQSGQRGQGTPFQLGNSPVNMGTYAGWATGTLTSAGSGTTTMVAWEPSQPSSGTRTTWHRVCGYLNLSVVTTATLTVNVTTWDENNSSATLTMAVTKGNGAAGASATVAGYYTFICPMVPMTQSTASTNTIASNIVITGGSAVVSGDWAAFIEKVG